MPGPGNLKSKHLPLTYLNHGEYFKERGRKRKQSYDICCVYVSSFSNRANTTWEMVAHCLLSHIEEREHV